MTSRRAAFGWAVVTMAALQCTTQEGAPDPRPDADVARDAASTVDGDAENSDASSMDDRDSGGRDAMPDSAGGDAAGPSPPIDLRTAAIYAVYPKIYSQTGTLAAVTADLRRIHDLGFDVLYLMPVTPIGQATGGHPTIGSPYCVHDYYAINPAFGTEQDLKTLVSSAHALGMHVLLDQVLNHTAWDNALLTQHPEYFVHNDGNPQNVASIQQAFTFPDVAQLDYKTPSNGLAKYMTDMVVHWLTTYQVDGFRFDGADNPFGAGRMIPASFWQSLRTTLEAAKPGVLMLGEEEDPELALAPFQLDYGWHLQGLYGDGGLRQVATGDNAGLLKQAWTYESTQYPASMRHMTLLQNWDLDMDLRLYGGIPNTKAAATFVFTIDGVPLLFNGEEVGNDNGSVNTQTPIHWNNPNATSFTAFYRSLLALRNANPALQQGAVGWIDNTAPAHVVSYTRSAAGTTFLVLINFSGTPVTGTVSAPAASGWDDVSPVGSPGATAHVAPPSLSLQAFDFAVFRAR